MVRMGVSWLLVACVAAVVLGSGAARPLVPGGSLRGNYGYVTRYNVSEQEARLAVREMFATYGVREVQFYDVAYSYSHPMPTSNASSWVTKASACFTGVPRTVQRDTVLAYIDEIRKLGGRSWMYVQAVGADEPASDIPGSTPYLAASGKQITWLKNSPHPCLYVYQPTKAWAQRQASIWGPAAAELGFDGIHWDQLGAQSDSAAQNRWMGGNFSLYLQEASKLLRDGWGLTQSFNFVDGFGWMSHLFTGGDAGNNTVAFPYWECWSDSAEQSFFDLGIPGSVFARYPDPGCCGNPQGFSADSLMIARFNKSAAACGSYILVGDGNRYVARGEWRGTGCSAVGPSGPAATLTLPVACRRLVRDYWPAAIPLTGDEAHALQGIVRSSQPQCGKT